jgi:hypothetical protein
MPSFDLPDTGCDLVSGAKHRPQTSSDPSRSSPESSATAPKSYDRSTHLLPAAEVHSRLTVALQVLQRAERNAVLWYAEVLRRKLYRDLGYASIQAYSSEALGFSRSKTCQFIRLANQLTGLPRLREAVARGELGWTKAREVAKVATPRTEKRLIAMAKQTSNRQLEEEVREIRSGARAAGKQAALHGGHTALAVEAPVSVTLRFSTEQFARFEALLETIRKRASRRRANSLRALDRLELVLAALNDLAERLEEDPDRAPAPSDQPDGLTRKIQTPARSPYQVIVYTCERCGRSGLQTSRGPKPLPRAMQEVIACDSRIQNPGRPNRSTVPPGLRRTALVRAHHRCEAPGCEHTRFLEVHHILPREQGGTNDLANLRVLCSSCHRLLHELQSAMPAPAASSLDHQTIDEVMTDTRSST